MADPRVRKERNVASQLSREKRMRRPDIQKLNQATAPTPPTAKPAPKPQANRETVRRYEDAFATKKKKR